MSAHLQLCSVAVCAQRSTTAGHTILRTFSSTIPQHPTAAPVPTVRTVRKGAASPPSAFGYPPTAVGNVGYPPTAAGSPS